MNTRGTSLWEKYVEHAIIAAAILVVSWFAWNAFGTKISIQISGRTVTADTVDDDLKFAANKLKPTLSKDAKATFQITPVNQSESSLSDQMAPSVSPNDYVFFPTIDMTADIELNKHVQTELRHYVVPNIAAPEDVRTHQWFGTILQSEIGREEELQAMIVGPPHDTSWVQVAAKFDVDEIVSAFATASEGFEAIPTQWYDGGADIFDIQIERQVLGENGWLRPELVSVLPGHLTYRAGSTEKQIDMTERELIIRLLRGGRQSEITNPDFYGLKGAVPTNLDSPQSWGGTVAVEDDDSQENEFERQLRRLVKKIERQRKMIIGIEDRIDREGRGGGGGGGIGGGGGPGGGSGGRSPSKIDRLRKQLDNANDELIELLDEEDELKAEIEGLGAESTDDEEVIMSGEVWVWGHDATIQPGETYQYRMIIQLANPFFGHKPSLYDEQQDLAEKATMASATSEWSESILVQEPVQWFVGGATQSGESITRDALDVGKISAEVFEFSDGSWESNSIAIQVGHRLGLGKVGGFTSDWFVLDILEDTFGEAVLLQHLNSGVVKLIRPKLHASSLELQQLRRQVRSQTTTAEEDEDEDDSGRPPPRPGGPMGGGGGGI